MSMTGDPGGRSRAGHAPVVLLGIVAGVVPLCLVGGYDLAFGPLDDDSIYSWQVIVGPPAIAAACAPWIGVRRAVLVAVLGVLVAGLALAALWVVLLGGGGGG